MGIEGKERLAPSPTKSPTTERDGVSICLSLCGAVLKRLNESRYCLGWKFLGTQDTPHNMGYQSNSSFDAAFANFLWPLSFPFTATF